MKNMFLVRYSDSWADEINIKGFAIMTDIQWNRYRRRCQDKFYEYEDEKIISYCVGTNEEIEYYWFEDFLAAFEVTSITEEQAVMLTSLFGTVYDNFPFDNFIFGVDEGIDDNEFVLRDRKE